MSRKVVNLYGSETTKKAVAASSANYDMNNIVDMTGISPEGMAFIAEASDSASSPSVTVILQTSNKEKPSAAAADWVDIGSSVMTINGDSNFGDFDFALIPGRWLRAKLTEGSGGTVNVWLSATVSEEL